MVLELLILNDLHILHVKALWPKLLEKLLRQEVTGYDYGSHCSNRKSKGMCSIGERSTRLELLGMLLPLRHDAA